MKNKQKAILGQKVIQKYRNAYILSKQGQGVGMATVINSIKNREDELLLSRVLGRILPYKLFDALRGNGEALLHVEEIRCRRNRRLYLTCGGQNIILGYVVTDADMEYIFNAICGGSLYAHKDTVIEGYEDPTILVGTDGEIEVVRSTPITVRAATWEECIEAHPGGVAFEDKEKFKSKSK